MKEIIELDVGTRFEYDPDREEIIVREREHDRCHAFSAEKFEEVVGRMQEMGWIGGHAPEHSHTTPDGPSQILHS